MPKAYKVELPPGNETYQAAFDQYMNLWQSDPAMAEVTLHPELGRTAAALLGVDAVRVYHDQALYKVAGGGHTPWHQDQWYWPLDTDRTITMWLPLHDVDPAMGDLEFAAGTHAGPIGDEAISDEADAFYDRHLADADIARKSTGSMRAGDASFHLGWTLHRANPNLTDHDREVMTVIWFADGARVTEPANDGQQLDRLDLVAATSSPANLRRARSTRWSVSSERRCRRRGGVTPSSTRSIRGRSPTRTVTGSATSPGSPASSTTWPTSASTRCGCRRSSPRRCATSATTSPTTAASTRCSAPTPTSTR